MKGLKHAILNINVTIVTIVNFDACFLFIGVILIARLKESLNGKLKNCDSIVTP